MEWIWFLHIFDAPFKNSAATCAVTVCAWIEQLISAFPLIGGWKDMYNNNILTSGHINAVSNIQLLFYRMLAQSLH